MALIRDDQNPLPLPVNGSTPKCIAAEVVVSMLGTMLEKSGKETEVGLFLPPTPRFLYTHPQAPSGCNEPGPLATAGAER